jgi:prepilin-type processing-associated H-X9-DG protein
MSRVAGFTLTAQVRDEAAAARAIDSLIKSFNPILRQFLRGIPRNRVARSLAFLKFEKSGGPHPRYTLEFPPDSLPQPYLKALRPAVMLGRGQLVVSASTPAAEQALAGGPRWQPDGAFVPVVKRLPAKMVYLGLSDPRAGTAVFTTILPILVRQINAEIALAQRRAGKKPDDVLLRIDADRIPSSAELNRLLFPSSTTLTVNRQGATLTHREAIPTLTSPATAAVMVALALPSLRSSWEASRRVRCVSNFKQIGLAMHNYVASTNAFPRPAILDVRGKPLLSWRVAILPYIEEQELYDKFKRDEPWDSPHNKSLLKEMPTIYACPIRTVAEPFTTTYRVHVGKGALFENDREIGIADVIDGKSNTIAVVEAKEAVPWTKPDELSFDPAAAPSLEGTGSSHPGGFNASMADGSVHFIKNTIDLNVFRALITRAAGEVILADSF